jgi:two-component system response regulator RegA
MTAWKQALVIDESQDILRMFQIWFSDHGVTMHGASSANQALEICKEQPLDTILADVDFLGQSGLQLLASIRTLLPDARIFLMTAGLSNYTTDDLVNLGVVRCFSKPIPFAELAAILAS